jgi:ABC-type sugar transport system substrate-binding protein
MRKLFATVAAGCMLFAAGASADPFDDGMSQNFYNDIRGKSVVMVPYSMGEPIGAGVATGLERLSKELDFQFSVRDPNWSIDQGVQAISQVINEQPDVLVIQNIDLQAYGRVIQRAESVGIRVVQINVKSMANSTASVGVDWYWISRKQAEAVVEKCSPANGGNGKVAILQGTPNNPTNFIGLKAFTNVFAENPDIQLVSDQAAGWDASRAHSVASTVLRQHPDLCGYLGFWDGQDSGIAAAVREAGLTGKVFVATQGGAEQSACEMVRNGSYDYYRGYNVRELSKMLNAAVLVALQAEKGKAIDPFAIYVESRPITLETLSDSSCWTMDQIRAGI